MRKIFLRTENGNFVLSTVCLDTKVSDLKHGLSCVLSFNGRILNDDKMVFEYELENYDVISLVSVLRGGMKVYVKRMDDITEVLNIDSASTLEDLKRKIFSKVRVPVNKQILMYKGSVLSCNGATIGNCKITEGATIDLNVESMIPVYISTSNNRRKILVSENDTVLRCKWKISEYVGIHPQDQKLSFKSNTLDNDNNTVLSCGIEKDSELVVEEIPKTLKLFGRTMDGYRIVISVNDTDGFGDFKHSSTTDLNLLQQRAVMRGKISHYFEETDEDENVFISLNTKKISVVLAVPNGFQYTIRVFDLETIENLKWKLFLRTKLQPLDMTIMQGNDVLSDNVVLMDFRIKDNTVLNVRMTNVTIIVEKMNEEKILIEVSQSETVENVKRQICLALNIQTDVRLLLGHLSLDDSDTIDQYGIAHMSTFHITQRIQIKVNMKQQTNVIQEKHSLFYKNEHYTQFDIFDDIRIFELKELLCSFVKQHPLNFFLESGGRVMQDDDPVGKYNIDKSNSIQVTVKDTKI